MENKINIAELLKDCPKGMELDCTIYDNATFCCILEDNRYPIKIQTPEDHMLLSKYGCMSLSAHTKCVIFPKGKTTWDGFVPPCKFKAGDVLVSERGNIVLFSHIDSENIVHYHCITSTYDDFRIKENTDIGVGKYYDCVLANEQQRQRMYYKIKCSGYKYNQQLNKLEKLTKQKFKDGDIVSTLCGSWIGIVKKPFMGAYETYITIFDEIVVNNNSVLYFDNFATEEEKVKLFQAIKKHGYKWNTETKTLEKVIEPKFKVGDKVRYKNNHNVIFTITSIEEDYYVCGDGKAFWFSERDDYELVPNKFDITTLIPFESRVLARDGYS